MLMASHDRIDKARKILELDESATIPEIKEAYRKLSLKYHPDKCMEKDKKKCEEKFKEINNANEVLIKYCLSYKIRLKNPEDIGTAEEKAAKDHMERFYGGWWGDLNDD
jgi:preprotein translocase subunit Sec63